MFMEDAWEAIVHSSNDIVIALSMTVDIVFGPEHTLCL